MTSEESFERMGAAGSEGTLRSAKTYSLPSASTRLTSSEASAPHLRAKPRAALVGAPDSSKAMLAAATQHSTEYQQIAQEMENELLK